MIIDALVTDEQIEKVFANTNFGNSDKRELIKYGVLKVASGYRDGHTMNCILRELKLTYWDRKGIYLTVKGKEYLWECFGKLGV